MAETDPHEAVVAALLPLCRLHGKEMRQQAENLARAPLGETADGR